MKNTIINILILILMFNITMIIFPDGKTQKFCRISLKIFIMIYVLDNIFLNGSIDISLLKNLSSGDASYEREVLINNVDSSFIDSINKDLFDGREAVKKISLNFTDGMNLKAIIDINIPLNSDETNKLKNHMADIFHMSTEDIYIR